MISFSSSIRVRQRKDGGLYRDCGLSFREIGSRVGRNQTTFLRLPFDAVYSRVVSPQDVHCLVYHCRQEGMKLSLLTSHASVCKNTMVGLESGDTMERGC
ncbi:hypothetical protein TNCV_3409361 [Trichonephila clavipes]|nr:hypothetical protein TNCV_3409361 [Trichonephila clavipes]